jgi:hypothetical protein
MKVGGKWRPFRVTLNYRRDDTSGHAGRLYDALAERFGSEHVFMDIDAIEPGVDFGEAIDPAFRRASFSRWARLSHVLTVVNGSPVDATSAGIVSPSS